MSKKQKDQAQSTIAISTLEATEVATNIIRREKKMKVAIGATLLSCGLFAPVTLPYIGFQKGKIQKLTKEKHKLTEIIESAQEERRNACNK